MTLNEAAQKNNGFERPVAYFKLNDAPLSGESLIYHDVRVTLTAGMEASDCTAEIVGQYSRFEDGELVLDAALESIVLGAKLEVFLGYGDSKNAESVFVGYVSSTELVVEGEKTSLIVTAMDCKQFMMNSYRSLRKKDIKKYSEAVSDVLKDYSALYSGTVVEATGETLAPIEQHNQSDLFFPWRSFDHDFLFLDLIRHPGRAFIDREPFKICFLSMLWQERCLKAATLRDHLQPVLKESDPEIFDLELIPVLDSDRTRPRICAVI